MCTMTWFVKDGGYELFFNRDERTSRSRAQLPSVQYTNGVNYISPTDVDAGGTWIAVNHFGISVCLLNHYQYEQIASYQKWISRGEIVRKFATIEDVAFAELMFNALGLNDFRAFRMFIIDRLGNNILCVWDGHKSRVERSVTTPKSSSSVDAKHVKSARKELFNELGLDSSKSTSNYLNYHAGHTPNKSQESVCMHRADANTVSLSHIVVNSETISFSYADGAPCEATLGNAEQITLVANVNDFAENQKTNITAVSS